MKNLSIDNNIEVKNWGKISLIKNNKKGLKEKAVAMFDKLAFEYICEKKEMSLLMN